MLHEGLITKSTGNSYFARLADGGSIECKLKGLFRNKGIKTTNPIAVGDRVLIDLSRKDEASITKILDRKNYIVRKATKLSKQSQIIASNIDQAFLIASLVNPHTTTGFIDRFLVTAEAYQIPARIIFNKMDIYDEPTQRQCATLIKRYERIGYLCYLTSATLGNNIETVRDLLKDKINLFAGHSGVGKSALINCIQPELNLKTMEISSYHEKGKHTTTFAQMYELSNNGFLIDTPGIKGFSLFEFSKEEISHYFPEMRALLNKCQYDNCMHINEPICAVKDAVDKGVIAKERYQSYLSILNTLD